MDHILALAIVSLYLVGSSVLLVKAAIARPEDRRRNFACGELALLPRRWRRWMLGEKAEPGGH